MCGKKGNRRCAKLRHIIPCEKHEGRYYSRYHGCVSCSAAAAREEKALAKVVLQPAANKAVVHASSDECRDAEKDGRAEEPSVKIGHNDKYSKGQQGKKEYPKRKKAKKNKTDNKKQVPHEQRWEGRGRRRRGKLGKRNNTACHLDRHRENNHEHDGLPAKEKGGRVAVAVAHEEKGKMCQPGGGRELDNPHLGRNKKRK